MFTEINSMDERQDQRNYSRMFVEIKMMGEINDPPVDALTADVSDTGMGLVTYMPFSIGTRITISRYGTYIATGEIINVDEWDCFGLTRLGVRFIDPGH